MSPLELVTTCAASTVCVHATQTLWQAFIAWIQRRRAARAAAAAKPCATNPAIPSAKKK